ncbi:hypothetical protein [Celeribacter sp.]|uniref:hypothetical protein n=1 Tax=Celeribacter sp. TaxID=1890673 RepID=UPI003A8F620A
MAGRIREGDDLVEKAEIDVMLVLLIIFMVAAPLSTVDVRAICPAPPPNPPSARLTDGAFDHANLAVDITGQIEAA